MSSKVPSFPAKLLNRSLCQSVGVFMPFRLLPTSERVLNFFQTFQERRIATADGSEDARGAAPLPSLPAYIRAGALYAEAARRRRASAFCAASLCACI